VTEPDTDDAAGQADPLDSVLDAAVLLQNNGQSTGTTLLAVDRLNSGLGVHGVLIPSWASLILGSSDHDGPARVSALTPTGINMRRVAAAMRVIDRAEDGPLDLAEVRAGISAAAALPPSHAAAFTLACATGAGALTVIFGAHDVRAVALSQYCAGHWAGTDSASWFRFSSPRWSPACSARPRHTCSWAPRQAWSRCVRRWCWFPVRTSSTARSISSRCAFHWDWRD
jgi:uncharacterized membrane protein YjjP (DUF1212 family)